MKGRWEYIIDFRRHSLIGYRVLLSCLLVFSYVNLSAQLYPVTAQLNILPPYSPLFHTLSDISSAPYRANKIQLMLTLNDLNEPTLPVRLEWEISGPDASFSSASDFLDVPVTLIAGQPLVISNADLAGYFNPNSFNDFDVQGFSNSGGYLTEGEWTFCVTAYELTRGVQVSNTSCKFIFIEEYDPPIMIMPLDSVLPTFPQNIQVSWQPLHFGSFPVQYTVSIWEDIEGLTPDQITQSALPYYQKTIDQITNVFLQADAPPFFTGQAYWTQVQVKDLVNGPMGAPSFVFKNNGNSDVLRFVYGMNLGEECEIPEGLNYIEDDLQDIYVYWDGGDPPAQLGGGAEPSSDPISAAIPSQSLSTSSKIGRFSLSNTPLSLGSITGQSAGPSFEGFYRVMWKNITDDTDWETSETQDKWAEISEFKRGRVYKVVVNRVCSAEELTSDTLFIELSAMPPARPYECGQPPLDYVTENQDPLEALVAGDTVIAGDIRVVVSEATGGSGTFSGNGYFPAPMLKSVRIGIEFSGIFVNDEYRLVSGEINTIFDETGSNIMDVDSLLSLFDGMDQDLPDITVDGVIDTIIIVDDQAMVILENGDTVYVDQPSQVTGSDGVTYVVSGGYVMPVVDIENLPQDFAEGFRINFEQDPEQNYGFDGYKEALDDQYEDFAGYKIPYKSVAYGGRDGVLANVDFSIPGLIDSLKFYTESGLEYGYTKINESQVRLEVTGLSEGVERVVAMLPDTGIVGILNVASYPLYDIKVHLVPVNNAGNNLDIQTIQNDINRILLQGAFSATVDRLSGIFDTDSDGEIGAENHFLAAYSPDMQRILGKLETSEDNEFYIFLVDNLEGNVTGFMPKGLNKGFVDVGSSDLARTIAHELGHGPFTLDHSWEQYSGLSQGTSDNLMDYNEGSGAGSTLLFKQWEKMHNPDVEMPWVQDEEGALEAALADITEEEAGDSPEIDHKAIAKCIIEKAVEQGVLGKFFYEANGSKIIKLEPNDSPVLFTNSGKLKQFTRNGQLYTAYWCTHVEQNGELLKDANGKLQVGTKRFVGYAPASNAGHFKVKSDVLALNYTSSELPKIVKYDEANCSIIIDDIPFRSNECCNKDFVHIVNLSDLPLAKESIASLFNGEESVPDEYSGTRRDLKAYLYVTDSDSNLDSVQNVTVPQGYRKIWIHYDGINYSVRGIDSKLYTALDAYCVSSGISSESFFSTFFNSITGTIDAIATQTYLLLDKLSKSIEGLKIDEKIWNCDKPDKYQSFYKDIFAVLTKPIQVAQDFLFQDVLKITNQTLLALNSSEAKFAALCGTWNGIIDLIKAIPDVLKIVPQAMSAQGRAQIMSQIDQLSGYKAFDEDSVLIKEGMFWAIVDGVTGMFDPNKPCEFSHNVTNLTIPIVIMFIPGGQAAGASVAGRIIGVLQKITQVADKLDIVSFALGKALFMTSKVGKKLFQIVGEEVTFYVKKANGDIEFKQATPDDINSKYTKDGGTDKYDGEEVIDYNDPRIRSRQAWDDFSRHLLGSIYSNPFLDPVLLGKFTNYISALTAEGIEDFASLLAKIQQSSIEVYNKLNAESIRARRYFDFKKNGPVEFGLSQADWNAIKNKFPDKELELEVLFLNVKKSKTDLLKSDLMNNSELNIEFAENILNNPNRIQIWEEFADLTFYNGSKIGHDIRLNKNFLEKYSRLTVDQKVAMKDYMNKQKAPAGKKGMVDYFEERDVPGLGKVKIYYDKNGFPEFKEFCAKPTDRYKLISENLKGTIADFKFANETIAAKFGFKKPYPKGPDGKFIELESNGYKWTPGKNNFELDGVKYTWHHHQDGKNIFPVQSRVHSTTEQNSLGFPHSGGDKLINEGLKDFFDGPGF